MNVFLKEERGIWCTNNGERVDYYEMEKRQLLNLFKSNKQLLILHILHLYGF